MKENACGKLVNIMQKLYKFWLGISKCLTWS